MEPWIRLNALCVATPIIRSSPLASMVPISDVKKNMVTAEQIPDLSM
jgi:hypothetical protein